MPQAAVASATGVPSITAIPPVIKPAANPVVIATFSSGFIVIRVSRIDYQNNKLMEETYIPLNKFDIEPSIDDLFWEEKVKRSIQDCDSVSALKEMATLLARIATQRQGVIRGLVKDIHIFNNVLIDKDDIANPDFSS